MNQLEQLKSMTTVVVDSGDINAIAKFSPIDATTNPSLILKAIKQSQYQHLIKQAVDATQNDRWSSDRIEKTADKLTVIMGVEILKHIPGRVSTEVNARLSFDTEATINKARDLISLYRDVGIDRSRVLIKIASTWEGIQAARVLEREGIKCNLTLVFHFIQAQACADAEVFLISPFVGRILDWYKKNEPEIDNTGDNDPGVASVRHIYNFYKYFNYQTIVMGASFRNISEIQSLAGCDRLTISPSLLEELAKQTGTLERKLQAAKESDDRPPAITEKEFRWYMNASAMATEKLAEGIRAFADDQDELENIIKQYISGQEEQSD